MDTSDRAARRLSSLLLVAWGAVWLGSLLVVVSQLGPASLIAAPAHESEARSLLGVALYPAHALRELPHLILLALVWTGAVARPRDGRDLARRLARLVLLAVGCGAVLIAITAADGGLASAWLDLAQGRAASDLEGAGVHFRFHLLSDIALGGLFFATGRTVASTAGRSSFGGWIPVSMAGGLFLAGIAAWGVDAVGSPRFVGHAGREVETVALVALPVLWALALRSPGAGLELRRVLAERGARVALTVAAGGSGLLLWLAAGADLMAASSAPERSVALNLAVHHFEHLFDLAFLVAAGCLTGAGPATDQGAAAFRGGTGGPSLR